MVSLGVSYVYPAYLLPFLGRYAAIMYIYFDDPLIIMGLLDVFLRDVGKELLTQLLSLL